MANPSLANLSVLEVLAKMSAGKYHRNFAILKSSRTGLARHLYKWKSLTQQQPFNLISFLHGLVMALALMDIEDDNEIVFGHRFRVFRNRETPMENCSVCFYLQIRRIN